MAPQIFIDPSTRYPKSLWRPDGKEEVVFGYEEHVQKRHRGYTEEPPRESRESFEASAALQTSREVRKVK